MSLNSIAHSCRSTQSLTHVTQLNRSLISLNSIAHSCHSTQSLTHVVQLNRCNCLTRVIHTSGLQIPDRVPTLVVNVDGVVLWQDKEHISGPKCIKRPGADRFFKELAQFYEIVLWSSEEYPVS
eukprot:GHVN01053212.1.p4 GENE.GHVN01053212.1~~GHVN01053212.1.p4  ORF type:complete len:124 (+),score=41.27 GHVN01053212.1:2336-2707(+)